MFSYVWTKKRQRICHEFENLNPKHTVILKTERKEQQYLGAKWRVLYSRCSAFPLPRENRHSNVYFRSKTFGWILAICLKTGFLLVRGGKVKDWFAENFRAPLCYGEEEIEDYCSLELTSSDCRYLDMQLQLGEYHYHNSTVTTSVQG